MAFEPIDGRCNTKREDGTFCERWPWKAGGNGRCKKHHGRHRSVMTPTPENTAYPSRYGKYLPPRLQDRYKVALTDPTLLSSREDIALMDARIEDLVRRADTGESGRTWEQLMQQRAEFLSARQRKDSEAAQAALQSIMNLIAHGFGDHRTWDDIKDTVLDRSKLVRQEQRRLVDMSQMVTVERLVNFMQVLGTILISEIPDKSVARRVTSRVQALLTIDGSAREVD